MKQFKLVAACVIAMLFSDHIQAVDPKQPNPADIIIEKLDADVKLDKKQRDIIRKKANIYIAKMKEANTLTLDGKKFFYHKQAFDVFEASLDSILTSSQKELRKVKQNERKTLETNRNKKK